MQTATTTALMAEALLGEGITQQEDGMWCGYGEIRVNKSPNGSIRTRRLTSSTSSAVIRVFKKRTGCSLEAGHCGTLTSVAYAANLGSGTSCGNTEKRNCTTRKAVETPCTAGAHECGT